MAVLFAKTGKAVRLTGSVLQSGYVKAWRLPIRHMLAATILAVAALPALAQTAAPRPNPAPDAPATSAPQQAEPVAPSLEAGSTPVQGAATSPPLAEGAAADPVPAIAPLPMLLDAGAPFMEPGEPVTADFAYGVFQRGLYLTTLAVAMPLAEEGDKAAQTLVGVLHETGLGIAQDKTKAAEWYQLAAIAGDMGAAYRLGQMYLTGDGVTADKKKAADLFEKAAEAGNPAAMYNLAILFQSGEGRPYDEAEANRLLQQAAELEDVEAQYALGLQFLEGNETVRDPIRGANWLGRAARRGHLSAQVYYGILRFQGRGVEPDEKEAADWFERAAIAGNPVGMNRLARIYAFGRGREIDPVEATAWHYVARAVGLSDLQLDGYVGSLDKETVGKAMKRAEALSASLLPKQQDPAAASP
ncbi:SEL1-like repeat protein [Pannonibacter carbonis]|uniref:SEL1-like repeat protein n=1 Tax=Pannonibacter carbonis TaxID=2067569 RepID=UPI000D0E5339|nr:SEL1-like repeat protein [Pannonibacter carbonis]